jgi:hypothetical protein
MSKYEYKFVRLGERWLGPSSDAKREYQQEIKTHAAQGWRLVQVFAPGYFELILEREV